MTTSNIPDVSPSSDCCADPCIQPHCPFCGNTISINPYPYCTVCKEYKIVPEIRCTSCGEEES